MLLKSGYPSGSRLQTQSQAFCLACEPVRSALSSSPGLFPTPNPIQVMQPQMTAANLLIFTPKMTGKGSSPFL